MNMKRCQYAMQADPMQSNRSLNFLSIPAFSFHHHSSHHHEHPAH
jgi:hypothetical protein